MRISSYTLSIADAQLDDLHHRLAAARWPLEAHADDWTRGVPPAYAMKLRDYWLHEYDWRREEASLNRHPQFIAEIDGQPIHFFHARSRHPGALPLMLLHGWPSSSIEFIGLLERLTDPTSHGGRAGDAFHVVVPTTPGFGLSIPLREGWDAMRTARAYHRLMRALGYDAWGVHGGDIGADIAGEMNHLEGGLVGVHVSTDLPSLIWFARFTGGDPASAPGQSEAERAMVLDVMARMAEDGGYLEIQRTRPSTIGYLLNDSPLGQLAWMAEKFKRWTGQGDRLPEETIGIDRLLAIVSLYWFTMSGASAAQFLCTNLHAARDWGRPSFAPVGMAVFGARGNARALHAAGHAPAYWSEFPDGGHFPALETPDLLVQDLRTFFRGLAAARGAPQMTA
jgi:pimeloyl-ACP methyl ester carboxylesterase